MGGGALGEAALSPWLVLALLPLVLAACTSFTKVVVVLGALRIGLGARELLPYGVVVALSLLVSAIVMAPVLVSTVGAVELGGGLAKLSESPERWWAVLEPLRAFMRTHASEAELDYFAALADAGVNDPQVLVPAFLVTELGEALHVSVLVLLPFVVVDLLLAEIIALVGLPQLPVATVGLPAKILLFLAAGGWDVVIGGLVRAYA